MIDLTNSPEKLKTSILQEAMQGKLTKQLPEDGNASELLKEIDNEKQKLIKEKKIKKQKTLPEITEDEIPFDIPSNWKWVRLGNIIYSNAGHNLNKYIDTSGQFFYSKVSDMNLEENMINITTTQNMITTNKYVLPKYSIIFPKIGGAIKTNKRRVIINERTSIDPNIMAITPILLSTFNFILIFMKNIDLSKIQSGTSVPSINNTKVNNLLIPLPPLAEQKRIVQKLDKLFNILD